MNGKIVKLGELEIDLDELAESIVWFKQNVYGGTYIGINGKKEIMPDGSKRIVLQHGNFWYEDNYDGNSQAPGRELVKWQKEEGQWIWQMAYSGGMEPEFFNNEWLKKNTFGFLKIALSRVTPDMPFRGSPDFQNENFMYICNVRGDIKKFSGDEAILSKRLGKYVFSQNFNGCLVFPK